MKNSIIKDNEYLSWFLDLKSIVKSNQIKAKLSVNSHLILLYWQLGSEINKKIKESDWGSKLIEQLSKDLKNEFPDIKGFSRANLYAIKKFNEFYSEFEFVQQAIGQIGKTKIVQQAVGQLGKNEIVPQAEGQLPEIVKLCSLIPWSHNLTIIEKIKDGDEVIFYITKTIENNWSRAVLEHQI